MKSEVFNGVDQKKSYKLTENIKYSKNQELLKQLAKDYDSFGQIEYSVGKNLEEIYKTKDYKVGLHFTGYSYVNQKFLDTIFQEGLRNNQHAMQGVIVPNIKLEDTVSFVDNFTIFIGQLKSASSYKNSQGAFLIKLPKEYLDTSIPPKKTITNL